MIDFKVPVTMKTVYVLFGTRKVMRDSEHGTGKWEDSEPVEMRFSTMFELRKFLADNPKITVKQAVEMIDVTNQLNSSGCKD